MKMTRVALSVALAVSSLLAACQAPAADVTQDESAIRQVFDNYIKSVNAADVALSSEVWLQSPDLVVITPLGRFQGWERVRGSPEPDLRLEEAAVGRSGERFRRRRSGGYGQRGAG